MLTARDVITLIERHPEQEQLILLSALSVLWLKPQDPEAAILLAHYRDRRFPFAALRETALQLFLLAGFQASLEAAFLIEAVYGHGLADELQEEDRLDAALWHARGQELQAEVYRGNIEKLRANLAKVSPQLAVWTVLVGYGLTMSRPGLPPQWRELLEVAVLTVQGFDRQLHSHLRGALNLGASPAEVNIVLEVVKPLTPPDRYAHSLHMWRRVHDSFCQNGSGRAE